MSCVLGAQETDTDSRGCGMCAWCRKNGEATGRWAALEPTPNKLTSYREDQLGFFNSLIIFD